MNKTHISVPATKRGWHLYYRLPAPARGELPRIQVMRSDTSKVVFSLSRTDENIELVDFLCNASQAQVEASD